MTDSQTVLLTQAVSRLTIAVEKLDSLLRDEYPKRSEVERTFVSKRESRQLVIKMVVIALITVGSCFGLTVGVYSMCFVGENNPGVCALAPGYEARVARKDDVDSRLNKLEQQLAAKP